MSIKKIISLMNAFLWVPFMSIWSANLVFFIYCDGYSRFTNEQHLIFLIASTPIFLYSTLKFIIRMSRGDW